MSFLKNIFFLKNLFILNLLAQNSSDVVYVKYFESDFNFKSDLSMLSTERRGKAHLVVSYNSLNQPIKICLFYTSPSPRDWLQSSMPSYA